MKTSKAPVCRECHDPITPMVHPDDASKSLWGRLDWRSRDDWSPFFCDPGAWVLKLHEPFADLRTQPILPHTMCFTCGQEFATGHADTAHEPNYIEE